MRKIIEELVGLAKSGRVFLFRRGREQDIRPCANALVRLQQLQNADLLWLLSMLPKRAERSDWTLCPVLQMLEANSLEFEETCSGLIKTFRTLLMQPEQAPARARTLLKPSDKQFDTKLKDFFAEVGAVVDLGQRGYRSFEFIDSADGFPTPDFKAQKEGTTVLVEVKNVRVPDSVTEAAFAHWNAKKAELPDEFKFDVQLIPRGNGDELSPEQRGRLFNAIDELPRKPCPGTYSYDLGKGLKVSFVLRDGIGQMAWHDFVAVGFDKDLSGMRRVLLKTFDLTDDALNQLYSPIMRLPSTTPRVLYIRWNVPDRMFLEAQAAAERVQAALGQLFRPDYPELEFFVAPYL